MFGRVDELKPMANKAFCYFFCTGFISVSAYFPLAEKLFLWWQPLARERESRDRFSSRSRRRSLIVISLSSVRASGLLPFAMMFGDCVEYWVELCVCGREMRAELMRFLLRVYLWRISYWRLVECGGCCFVSYRQFRVCPLRWSEYSEAWTEFLIYKLGCEGIISRTLQVFVMFVTARTCVKTLICFSHIFIPLASVSLLRSCESTFSTFGVGSTQVCFAFAVHNVTTDLADNGSCMLLFL